MPGYALKQLPYLLLALFLGASSVLAQDTTETPFQKTIEQPDNAEPGESDAEKKQEEIEKSTDIREAILENLDLKAVEKESAEIAEVSPPTDSGQPTRTDEEPPPVENEPQWYDRFDPIVERVRRVPVLSNKGWLHFGRVELEYGHFSSSELLDGDSGFNFRSLRTGIVKLFDNGLFVKLDIDLTDGDSNFTDMYVRKSNKLGTFTIGNQKVAHSFVNQTSRLARTFMEEPLPAEAFGLNRRLGVGWDFHRKRIGAHLTAFGPDLNTQIGDFGYGARIYTNPTRTRFSMAHIGVSGVREKMDQDARFRARPESRVTETYLVDTLKTPDVDTQSIFGLETAFAHKNWSIRGEYFYTEWERNTQKTTSFSGYYLQANWVLTGESFQYKQGKFMRIRPNSSRGAWEVAVRYSNLNLNDQDIFGGIERNATLALNWYGPGNQLRVQSNLIYADAERLEGTETPLIVQIRVQIHW